MLHPYQSGFIKGESTLDAVVCLENEIRKALVKKEVVIGGFFFFTLRKRMTWCGKKGC